MKKKQFVGFDGMTAEELFEHNRLEYASSNPISQYLIRSFYQNVNGLIDKIEGPMESALELGCGCGEASLRIDTKIKQKFGAINFEISDVDARFIQILKSRNHPIPASEESVYSLPRENNSIDLIFLLEVLEHLENPEDALKEIFRVSKDYVLISVPHEPIWRLANMARAKYLADFGNTPGHINHFNYYSLKKMAAPFGRPVAARFPFPWVMILFKKTARIKDSLVW